jgi:hypothetical protein
MDESYRRLLRCEEVDPNWAGSDVSVQCMVVCAELTISSVLFYAPLYYAYISWKEGKSMEGLNFEDNRRTSYTDSPEKTPLLRQE